MPDYEYVHRELQKDGVTLNLLWLEHCEQCQDSDEISYQLTQFKKHCQDYALKANATMHLNHKPGEIMQVDWAGDSAGVIDTDTGERIPAYIFVAVLPYSDYAYVEAFFSMNQENWITAHVNAFRYFGGVTKILQCDNLKTGVISHGRTEVVLNKAYNEMAEHYGTAVLPCRVRSPKDKAMVEGTVRVILPIRVYPWRRLLQREERKMLTETTVNKLNEMKLTTMAKSFKAQLSDASMQNLSFEDRFGLLVDEEWTSRKNNHLQRLIRQARLSEPMACVEDIEYHSDRKLDPAFIAKLATCDYISERHNVLLLGATGCGKTYVACALGMAAARKFLSVRYVRLPDLLSDLAIARSNGTYRKAIQQYKKPAMLILDEWLLYPLKETEARDLLEIAEARYKRASTIFCSQFDVPGWRDKIGEPILADAICDRIVHDSYSIVIDCKESMRKRKGVKENPA